MAHPEMDTLLDEGLRVAIHFLEKNGEFFPFGVTLAPDGSVAHTQGYTGDECPPSLELIDLLLSAFKIGAATGDYKSVALISDVRISLDGKTKTDAISVTVEHVDDQPVICFLPYTKANGTIEFGEIVAERAEPRVFDK